MQKNKRSRWAGPSPPELPRGENNARAQPFESPPVPKIRSKVGQEFNDIPSITRSKGRESR